METNIDCGRFILHGIYGMIGEVGNGEFWAMCQVPVKEIRQASPSNRKSKCRPAGFACAQKVQTCHEVLLVGDRDGGILLTDARPCQSGRCCKDGRLTLACLSPSSDCTQRNS